MNPVKLVKMCVMTELDNLNSYGRTPEKNEDPKIKMVK